jgi:hypothetical protein
MTPKERVFRRLRGERVDKIPNLNILMTFAAKYIKVPYKKYVTGYGKTRETINLYGYKRQISGLFG